MKCPFCSESDSRVLDSRDVENTVRRRRECLGCGQRFTTYERVELVGLLVVKKDGRREPFDREKLLRGIRKACEKRPLPTKRVEEMVNDLEGELHQLRRAEVTSHEIGEKVMSHLRSLDEIAYIRFASVYRSFGDLQALRNELESLGPRSAQLDGDGSFRQNLSRELRSLTGSPDKETVVRGDRKADRGRKVRGRPSAAASPRARKPV